MRKEILVDNYLNKGCPELESLLLEVINPGGSVKATMGRTNHLDFRKTS